MKVNKAGGISRAHERPPLSRLFKREFHNNSMEFTVVIKKGEKQYVALCPELDVVSQGFTIEEAIRNLKEAVTLYIEEMGLPEGIGTQKLLITSLEVGHDAKTARPLRA